MKVRALLLACVVGYASPLAAQGVEVSPFGGYRFGGGFFELVAGRPVDTDGAPALGITVDVPIPSGLQIEGSFSHQQADFVVALQPSGTLQRFQVSVDHWQAGGLQEYGDGRVRPFATGLLGLTRYAAGGDNEVRFMIAAGGGVKLFPTPRVGFRLDGRVFATLIDAGQSAAACSGFGGTCLVALNLNTAWQAEFTAGLVVRLR